MPNVIKQNNVLKVGKYLWEGVSAPAQDLCDKLIRFTPSERLLPAEIIVHPWIAAGIAPATPLPNVLAGLQKLRLGGLQKLVLQVMDEAAAAGRGGAGRGTGRSKHDRSRASLGGSLGRVPAVPLPTAKRIRA